jgi:hypothetical protein
VEFEKSSWIGMKNLRSAEDAGFFGNKLDVVDHVMYRNAAQLLNLPSKIL